MKRCAWAGEGLYREYHDLEWGFPLHDEHKLFEFLILEGAQAGLSWSTILNKRENYRKVFANFDPVKVARFSDAKLEKLLLDPGIVRNRLKVLSARRNAKAFLKVQKEFSSFDTYLWAWVDHKPIQNRWKKLSDIPAETDLSRTISNDLKKRDFNFVGPTIIYALMQAVGMVNDHTVDCFRHKECAKP
jgi:DNA-3-methyladenine glycosylase I